MTTLVEFLTARLDEDEAVARDASKPCPPPWLPSEPPHSSVAAPLRASNGVPSVAGSPVALSHVSRHDPARVLREVAAKRSIVDFHEQWPVLAETPPEFEETGLDAMSIGFRMSQKIAWLTQQEYRARFGDEPPTAPMLRAMAAVYSDHPDYREEWR